LYQKKKKSLLKKIAPNPGACLRGPDLVKKWAEDYSRESTICGIVPTLLVKLSQLFVASYKSSLPVSAEKFWGHLKGSRNPTLPSAQVVDNYNSPDHTP